VTFPAGSVSGTSLSFDVHTLAASAPSEAKTINIALSSSDTATDASSSPPSVVIDAHGLPYLNPSLPISQRVNDLLSRMSLAEKIGQMTQADRFMFTDAATTSNSSANDLRAWLVGSLLSGGGDTPTPNTPTGWADMVDGFQTQALATPLQIPLIYGEDTVHGDGNMMGATIFPHNIAMGATRDPALTLAEGQVTAAETRATGPQWGFAPCLCVARDVRWGRTYESFGEDPALVSRMETEIDGLQGTSPQARTSGQSSLAANDHILATAKHFAGDGGTSYGTGDSNYPIDQGVDVMNSNTFQKLFVSPYVPAVQQHQQKIGFDGFLISDYNAVDEIGDSRSCPIPSPLPAGVADKYSYQIGVSANAGMDMFMVPSNYQTLDTDLTALVNNGVVPMSRINDAVARVLKQKFELGLFEHPFTDRSNIGQIGDAAHRAVAAKAAAASQPLPAAIKQPAASNRLQRGHLPRDGRLRVAEGRVLDVRDGAAIDALAAELGEVDIVFSNATARISPDADPVDEVDAVAETSNLATTRMLRAFAPRLRRGGRLIIVASALGTLDKLDDRVAGRFADAAENLDAVDSLVAEWRQAVHDGRADDEGYGTWLNVPSKVAQVAAVRAAAWQRRATDLAEDKLLMALCPGLVDTDASRPWFEDMSQAQTPVQAAAWPVELALAPSFDPAFYGELVQFGKVIPWASGIPVAHTATT
jgi:beta-glucosidase